jgi:protein-disulfide isomerase
LIDVNDHILGPMHAPVVVVEYGDFECPTCKQAAPAVKLLLERLSTRRLSGYAARLGLDMARYETEMRDHVYLQKIREHQDCARRSHVRGTPGFFVNGRIQDVTFGLRALFDAVTRAIAQHR